MAFTFESEDDHSEDLKDALVSGIDSYVGTGRTVSVDKANEIIRTVEAMLAETGRRRRGPGKGSRGRSRNKLARWAAEDFDALKALDWGTLDDIWESIKDGSITEDSDLKGDQKRAIMSAYNKVPGDKRAERSARANVVGRLKHLVSAYEAADQQGWRAS